MRCDDIRKSVTEGEPLDDAARGHLAGCAACGEEFPEIRALTSARPLPPDALRERVLGSFPARRGRFWPELTRAAAILLIGLVGGFVGGYVAKKPESREIVREVPVRVEVAAAPTDDYVFNVGLAGERVYGRMKWVEVLYDGLHVVKITLDPKVKNAAGMCPVARELDSLTERRPDLVEYKERDF
jgi:hypothetical protein